MVFQIVRTNELQRVFVGGFGRCVKGFADVLLLNERVNDRQARYVDEISGIVSVQVETVQQSGGSNQAIAERHLFLLPKLGCFVNDGVCHWHHPDGGKKGLEIVFVVGWQFVIA